MIGTCLMARRMCNLNTFRNISVIKNGINRSYPNSQYKLIRTPFRRPFYRSAYEGDGKTVGFVINKPNAEFFCVSSIQTQGFVLSNGAELVGSIVLFPHSMLNWHVTSLHDVNEESLILFNVLEPKLDILIYGYGSKEEYDQEAIQRFRKICKDFQLNYEVLPTEQACGLFNFLAMERRFVAGAFIPPKQIDPLRLSRHKNFLLDFDDYDDEEDEEEDKKEILIPGRSSEKENKQFRLSDKNSVSDSKPK